MRVSMRIDKFLSETGTMTRKESGKAVRSGRLTVNGKVVKEPDRHIDPEKDVIVLNGAVINYKKFTYIIMNKPQGYVSATDDPREQTVLDLLPEKEQRLGLFPCGRLDKNTTGLIVLTNDGVLAHKLLAPKTHVEKEYYFEVKFPISDDDIQCLEKGVDIGGYVTAPCKVKRLGERCANITLTEGKYHQIKLMLGAVHNQVMLLKRIRFDSLVLKEDELLEGQWRHLTAEEESSLQRN